MSTCTRENHYFYIKQIIIKICIWLLCGFRVDLKSYLNLEYYQRGLLFGLLLKLSIKYKYLLNKNKFYLIIFNHFITDVCYLFHNKKTSSSELIIE